MSLTKDGFYKSFSGAIGNNNYLLEAGGGHIGWGNSASQIPYSNGTVNSNLNADMVDGQHFTYSNLSNSPTYLWATNSNGTNFLAARGSISVNYANYAGYLTDFTRVSRVSKNSSNNEIETVTGWQTSGFIQIQRFCPPEMYRTTGDMPAPYGIGFGNGSESGGIMPVGSGDYLRELRFYGANSGPTLFTFTTQLWEGSSYDSRYSNRYQDPVVTIHSKTGDTFINGLLTLGKQVSSSNGNINRLCIVPYKHTGGPWYINSNDDSSNAYLRLLYGSTETFNIRHDGWSKTNRLWLNYGSNLGFDYSWTGAALTSPTIEIQNYTGTTESMYPTLTLHHYGYGGPRLGSRQGVLTIYGGNTDAKTLGSRNSYFSSMKIYPNEFDGLYVNDIKVLLGYRRSNLNISSTDSGMIAPDILGFKNGYPLYTDPEFSSGNNSISVYNNSGGSAVTITRQADSTCGNSSGYILKIHSSASSASPYGGGFYFASSGARGKVYVCIFRALIPSGYSVVWQSNSIGSGGNSGWLTSQTGTGKWEWYAYMVEWGTASLSSTFFFTLNAAANVDWYLSYANVIDITKGNYDGLRTRYSDYSNSADSATTCSYPAGFTSRGSTDWSGVAGTLATDWSVNGADIMFKYDGSKLNVITDGRFYQGIDIYGSSKRVLDEYDISHTKWGDADTLDGLHYTSFLRKDTNDSTSYQYTFSKTNDHAIQIGTIRGYSVGSCTGNYLHIYERVHIGSPSGWGSRNAPSYGLSTYGGAWLATDTGSVGIGTTSPSYKLHVAGDIAVSIESCFIGYMPRKKSGGGGWAYNTFQVKDYAGTDFAHLGVYGGDNSLTYIYIGSNNYDSTANLKIDTSGYTTATGYKKVNSSDSYVLLGGGGHKALSDFSMAHSHPYHPLGGSWKPSSLSSYTRHWGWAYSSAEAGLASNGSEMQIYTDGKFWQREGAYYCLDNGNTYVSSGTGVINGTTITQVSNSDTVDGFHHNHLMPFKYIYNGYTNSGSDWYLQLTTSDWISEDCIIFVRGGGNNTSSDMIIHVLCRENRYFGWQTSYNGVRVTGIYKETGSGEVIYLKMPSSTTSIDIKSTFSLTITKGDYSSKSYQNIGSEGFFANYIQGRIQNSDYADSLSSPGKYYWANLPMQTSANSSTSPTFNVTTHNGEIQANAGIKWAPGTNIRLPQSANSQEWSFDITRNGYTGGYWHVWDSSYGSLLTIYPDNGNVLANRYLGVGGNNLSYTFYVNGTAYHTGTLYVAGQPAIQTAAGTGNWNYIRMHNGSNFWDIATKSNSNSGALDFRPDGADNIGPRIDTNGRVQISNVSNSTYNYDGSSMWIREYHYGGSQSDTWGNAPRLGWHWSGRVAAQIGLASNGWLYEAPLTATNFYRIVVEGSTGVTWGINISGNADTVDSMHANEFVPKRHSPRFYPFVNSSYGQPWYKITLPWAGYTSGSNAWMMTTMEIVLGGSYSSGNNGRIYLQYYFNKNSSNAWGASDVRGTCIGYRLIENGVTIKYDIANPGIFYIKANANTYNSIGLENITANDTAPNFDFRNTTIEAIAESSVPSAANQTVPLYHTITTQNGYWANLSIQTSASDTQVPSFGAIRMNGVSSAGTNYITGTAGRIYFGGNFHIDSLGSNATYINYYSSNNVYLVSGSSQGNVGIGTSSPSSKLHVSGGLLKITNNSNTVTIGSQNSSWCHFENSASINFYFNRSIHVDGDVYLYGTSIRMQKSNGYVYSSGFYHNSYGSATYLLRSDGGAAAFNWSGQSGQPTWVWGGNSQHTYYVYNPSNFSVNYANYSGYSHKLDIYGYTSDGLSFYQTSNDFDEHGSGWSHYIIANHGNGASYYHYTIALPFWGPPQYRRQTGSTSSVTSWYTFLTTENWTSIVDGRYLRLAGGWMDWTAQVNFKGSGGSTSVYSRIGYAEGTINGVKMHTTQTNAFYICTNGDTSATDNAGLAIDNDGVTVFGAGDAGSVFRVLNEDNVSDGSQIQVTKSTGTYIRPRLSVGQNSINTSYNLYVNGTAYFTGALWTGSTIYSYGFYHRSYGSADYLLTSNGGAVYKTAIGPYGYLMKETLVDLSSLDGNTFYPVTFSLGAHSNVRIEVRVSLNTGQTDSNWMTHSSGFACRAIWEVNGSGWGTNPIDRTIYAYDSAWTNVGNPCGEIGQMGNASEEYIYLRGHAKYYIYTSHNVNPTLRTSTYSAGGQSISTKSSINTDVSTFGTSGGIFQGLSYSGSTLYVTVGGYQRTCTINSSSSISKSTSCGSNRYVVGTDSTSGTFSTAYCNSCFYFTTTGAYHTSDIRKKYDIRDIYNKDVIDLFNTENAFIRFFRWKEDNQAAYGFIAQELQEYCPEAVDFNNDTGFYSVNYNVAFSKIVGAMFKKIKELEKRLKEKENL